MARARLASRGVGLPGALLRLRKDDDEGERLLLLLDRRAEADLACFWPSVPVSPLAVQEQDHRILLVALVVRRHEEDVLSLLAVLVFVDAVEEAGFHGIVRAGRERPRHDEQHGRQHYLAHRRDLTTGEW